MSEPPDLAQALFNPDLYPDSPETIELLQTATSYVFLTGEYAYKIKKPVTPGYLDYSTLDKRKFYCNREVTLNRRLCPDIYLDTVNITEDKKGIAIENRGKAIEYAVKMKQMPGHAMLDKLLLSDSLPENAMSRIARTLADFHATTNTGKAINDYGNPEFILTGIEKNFIDTIRFISQTVSQKSYRIIKDFLTSFIERNTELFTSRVADDRIRDGHGNIRAGQVCLNEHVYIYDCIEYNDSLRYGDTAFDLALLLVDLDRHDRPDLSAELLKEYIAFSGDDPISEVIPFYKVYRAFEMGRWESVKLDVANLTDEEKTSITTTATRCFELAESYI